MRTLIATVILLGALLSSPAAADPCDPSVQAERHRVFIELADQGVRIAGVTGAGGHMEFSERTGADPHGCRHPTLSPDRVPGVTGVGGLTVR